MFKKSVSTLILALSMLHLTGCSERPHSVATQSGSDAEIKAIIADNEEGRHGFKGAMQRLFRNLLLLCG